MSLTSFGSGLRGLALSLSIAALPLAALAAGADDGHKHEPAAGHGDHQQHGQDEGHQNGQADSHAGHAAAAAPAQGGHDHGHAALGATQLQKGAALIEARRLYASRCAACHGERGRGTKVSAVDFGEAQALVRLTREAIADSLAGGHGGKLPAPLAAEEEDAIIGFLRNYLMLPAPDADTNIGRAIYSRSCSVCHGDRGDSASWAKNSLNPAPVDFTAHGLERLSRDKMIDTVTFGSKNTAMMPFTVQLSREEIAATVDYIRTAFMPEGMGPGVEGHDHGDAGHAGHDHGDQQQAAADDAPFPDGLVGDPAWGRTFYEANCAECHGVKGDGEGPRAYFMIKKPEDFLSRQAQTELDRPKLLEHVSKGVVGTTMPAWEKVLTAQEIANVAEYVYRAFLHRDRFAAIQAPVWQKTDPEPAKKN